MHVSTFQRAWVLENYELLAECICIHPCIDIGYVLWAIQDIPRLSILINPWPIDFSQGNNFDAFDIRDRNAITSSQVLSTSLHHSCIGREYLGEPDPEVKNISRQISNRVTQACSLVTTSDLTVSIVRVISSSENIIYRIRRYCLATWLSFEMQHFRIPSRLDRNENCKYVSIFVSWSLLIDFSKDWIKIDV